MQNILRNESPQEGVPFQIHVDEASLLPKEVDAVQFLKLTFAENPGKGLELLFRRYYKPLCSHAVRFVYSKQVAEDLVSEVFFQFFRTKTYENITTSYHSYLFRSVRNECYTYIRKELGRTGPLETSMETSIRATCPQPDAEIHYNNLFMKVSEVIGKLPLQCQRVFIMSRFENKKYHEIADELKISPKTVEIHVSKALKRLRLALNGEWMASGFATLITTSFHILF